MMQRRFAFLLAVGLALASAAMAADQAHRRSLWIDGGGEKFDVSDLQDGETRYFGEGERQLQATRTGDRITLTFGDEERGPEVRCSVEADDCAVVTTADGNVIVVQDGGGAGAPMSELTVRSAGPTEGALLIDSGGKEPSVATIRVDRDGGPFRVRSGGDDGTTVVELQLPRGTLLRCPEGDTTMRLGPDEADEGPYRCPRHGLELVKVPPGKEITTTVHVITQEGRQDQ